MSSKFFQNTKCEYYPCHSVHSGINCLFCFCPLYNLKDCGGNPKYLENGTKDCSDCILPHIPGHGYNHVINKLTGGDDNVPQDKEQTGEPEANREKGT